MMRESSIRKILPRAGLLIAVAALAGCGARNMNDLTQFVQQVQAQPGPPLQPIPQMKPYETYTYADQALRSPFAPQVDEQPTSTVRPDAHRNKEYLEQFPLDSLTMVGTIDMGGTRYALVRDSEGLVHQVKAGNYMGQNDGRILEISATALTLREIVPNGLGGYVKRETQVTLATDSSKAGKP
ncbi:MAG TPA: pilus assembly protein PilP [Gammaproteobacteria bacterium]|nr:pilus assembly protein PilP [Gammaproteobacteria bacterium]